MQDIDNMDMLGYLELRAWKANRKKKKKKNEPRHRFIDEVWPEMESG